MNSKYDVVIFDLDGTLIDSRLDLVNSVNFTRQQLGLPPLAPEVALSYIGDGAVTLIRRAIGEEFSQTALRESLGVFLAHYRDHLLDNTALYPGVLDALVSLRRQVLAILTNKPLKSTLDILHGLGIQSRFRFIYGGNSFQHKKPHPVGVERILEDSRFPPDRALIVGDSRIDIQTGLNARIATCGVTYGLASESLAECHPHFLIGDLRELPPILFG